MKRVEKNMRDSGDVRRMLTWGFRFISGARESVTFRYGSCALCNNEPQSKALSRLGECASNRESEAENPRPLATARMWLPCILVGTVEPCSQFGNASGRGATYMAGRQSAFAISS
jgi:hypothetical protein